MENKTIRILLLMVLFCFSSIHWTIAQQNFIVTVQPIFVNGFGVCTPGQITFDASNAPPEHFPIIITVEDSPEPGCWVVGTQITLTELSPVHIQNIGCQPFTLGTCEGLYCFSALRAPGTDFECEIEFCKIVMYCSQKSPTSKVWCRSIQLPPQPIIGDDDNSGNVYASGYSLVNGRNGTEDVDSEYMFYTYMSDANLNSIFNKIKATIDNVVLEIDEKGYSIYEVESQNEVNTDDRYIFKFDSQGDIIWVSHKIDAGTRKDISGNLAHSGPEQDIDDSLPQTNTVIKSLYPNPFSDKINFEIQSKTDQSVEVALIDLTGKVVKQAMYNLSSGYNQLSIDLSKEIPTGLYLFTITDNDGYRLSRQMVHGR